MSVMRDYAKQDFAVPKRVPPRTRDIVSVKDMIAGGVAILLMGSVLGLIIGYGLLYTGV